MAERVAECEFESGRSFVIEGHEFFFSVHDLRRFPQCVLAHGLEQDEEPFGAAPVDLVGHSVAFLRLLSEFLKAQSAENHFAPEGYRCLILAPVPCHEDLDIQFFSANGGEPLAGRLVREGEQISAVVHTEVAMRCTELVVAVRSNDITCGSPALPRFRVEVSSGGQWLPIEYRTAPECHCDVSMCRSVRCFLGCAAPMHDFEVPQEWCISQDIESLFWREARFYHIFEMEMSMAKRLLTKLLKVYLTNDNYVFKQWPSRDRHQFWACLWLAMSFIPGRSYHQTELKWMIAWHLVTPEPSLIVAMSTEMERRGFLKKDTCGKFHISTDCIRWTLDGDKLFRARTCAIDAGVERPWWSLPLKTQLLVLAGGPTGGSPAPMVYEKRCNDLECPRWHYRVEGQEFILTEADMCSFPESPLMLNHSRQGGIESEVIEFSGRSAEFFQLLADYLVVSRIARVPSTFAGYRCVLLDPLKDITNNKYADESVNVLFLPAHGNASLAINHTSTVDEGAHLFTAFESHFPEAVACPEFSIAIMVEDQFRLPPFRIDVCNGPQLDASLGWRTILCQPMPAADEVCSHGGRTMARCFLPHAVPVENFRLDSNWIDGGEKEAIFFREAAFYGIHGLELAAGRLVLERRLQTFMSGTPLALAQWPGKDRQQFWATLWLASHFVPGRLYLESEVDWVLARHHTGARVPDCAVLRKELERRRFMERQPGGGGFSVLLDGIRSALRAHD